jgi:PAS domain S-box-containing protein
MLGKLLSNIKLRTQLLLIVISLILVPLIAIAIGVYWQLDKIESNAKKDATKTLRSQLNTMLESQRDHQISIIGHHFSETGNETYTIGKIATKIFQNPDPYISLQDWNLREKLIKAKSGQYLSRKNDRVNVFIANFAVLDKQLESFVNASAYLDQFFRMEYETQQGITNAYLALLNPTYIRLFPNKMQTSNLAPDFVFKDSVFLKAAAGKDIRKITSIWTLPYVDVGGAGQMITCLSPILSKDNTFVGTIGIDVSIRTIIEQFAPVYQNRDIFSFIIDNDANIIALDKTKNHFLGITGTPGQMMNITRSTDPEIRNLAYKIIGSENGSVSATVVGKQRIFSFAAVPSMRWKYVITASLDEVDKEAAPIAASIGQDFRKIRIIWSVLFFFLAFLSVTALVRISRNVVEPLGKMAEASKALEKGEIPKPLGISGGNEISAFAKSFDNLVLTLLQRQNDVNSIQRFLRSIVRNSPDMIIVTDTNNKIMEFNQAAEIMLGYSSNDVMGLGFELFFYDLHEFNDLIKTVARENRISSKEVTMITQDGEPIEVSLSLALIKDEKEKAAELIAIGKDITEKKDREKEVLKRVRQLEMLHKTIFTSTSILDLDYLLQKMAKTIQENFQYHSVEIYAIDHEQSELIIGGKAGPYKYLIPEKYRHTFSEGILGLVAKTGETYLCQNIQEDPYYTVRFIPFTQSELCVPIKSGSDIVGLIDIEQADADAFDAQDVITIEAISAGIYSSIKNIELYKSLKQRIDELTVFHEFSNILMSTLNLDELLKRILAVLEKTFHYSNAAIFQMDEDNKVLSLWSFYGYPDEFMNIVVPVGKGITGWSAQDKKIIVVPDVNKEDRYLCTLDTVKSEVAIPLMLGEKVIGVLDVGSEHYNYFNQGEINLLTSLAAQIAMTIDNASLYKQLEHAHKKLKESFIGILKALTAAIEAKDSYTDGHVQRTSTYAELVAKELHLSQEMIETVKYASILHDIGKIGIPESILLKPGKLSPEERKIMQRHPEIGVNIIKDIDFLKNAIPAIMYHQERYDGDKEADFPAYPNGLKETAIPMAAHIVAVVDAYDAMTSNRPYRKAMSPEDAIKILLEEKGKQFHPEVIEAFIRILQRTNNLLLPDDWNK